MELKTARGVQDISPEQKIVKETIIKKIKTIFERYGYSPFETPIIERFDVLSSKYAGGAEILKETFQLKDQGGRELCLRYDLTVPFARFVGMNKNIKMPFKRYQIGEVFRDGPIKLGRMREFWQCDADIVGSKSMKADAELLLIAKDVFNDLNIDVIIKLNNRKVLNSILNYANVDSEDQETVIVTIDKLGKVGEEEVKKELEEKKIEKNSVDVIMDLLEKNKNIESNEEKINFLRDNLSDEGLEGLKEVEEVLSYCEGNIYFDFSLARGLSYYTNTVFEAFISDGSFASSLAGGGRYNKMIGNFLESEDPEAYPAVGISFGLEPITVVMKNENNRKTVTQVYVIPIGLDKEAFKVAQELRRQGLNVDIDLLGRGVSKNLQFVDSYNIPFTVFVGKEELEKGKFKVKNMSTGEEIFMPLDKIKSLINNNNNN